MDVNQKYKGKATISLGEQNIDVFDVTKEQIKQHFKIFDLGLGNPEELAKTVWEELVVKEREKVIRFTDNPEEFKKHLGRV